MRNLSSGFEVFIRMKNLYALIIILININRRANTKNRIFNTQYASYKNLKGKHSGGKLYRKEGKIMDDWWSDIAPVSTASKEKSGYPTQKPETLLERIIKASSNKGDIVLDAFCGSGTTLYVAKKLNRNYIGIDNNSKAIRLTKNRLKQINKTKSGVLGWIGTNLEETIPYTRKLTMLEKFFIKPLNIIGES